MAIYYVNKNSQLTGEHEIHTSVCVYLPDSQNRIYLGPFDHCEEAVDEARKYFSNVDGCYHCSRDCHTR